MMQLTFKIISTVNKDVLQYVMCFIVIIIEGLRVIT